MTNTKPGRAMVAAPYSPVIGHTSTGPVFRAAGGRSSGIDFIVGDDEGDDPDFEDEDDEDEEDEDDEPRSRRQGRDDYQDDDDSTWRPLTREAQAAMETALQKANREAMTRRKAGKILDRLGVHDVSSLEEFLRSRGIDPETGDRHDSEDADGYEGDDADADAKAARRPVGDKARAAREKLRAEQRGAARTEAKYRDATTLLAAENALMGAGWTGGNISLALKLIDPDRVDITMDGGELSIDGLEEQIAEIKDEFPTWFRPTSRDRNANRRREERGGARGVDGGNRERAPARKVGWKESISRQMDRGR